jgi:hypothetical protein
MQRLNKDRTRGAANRKSLAPQSGWYGKVLYLVLLASIMMLSACGGSSSSGGSQQNAAIAGNWQFSMTPADPNYPAGAQYGLQGGFLLQKNGTVTGQVAYSIASDQLQNGQVVACDSGSATITGTINGQSVKLTAAAGTQTFTLSGTLGSNGSITNGTFTTPGGQVTTSGGQVVCGAATPQGATQAWSAISVPSLTGTVSGTFHSTDASLLVNGALLNNQDFQVTGNLSQGDNIGASSATVTGQLSFVDPTTLLSMYPCFPGGYVNVNGQISGNTVILQLIGTDGSNNGQIGIPASELGNSTGFAQVTLDPTSANGAYVLHSTGQGYQVNTKTCRTPAGSGVGEFGYICLGLNSTSACQQPITFSPPFLTFSPQLLMCSAQDCPPSGLGTSTTQTVTLTNNQASGSAPLTNLTLTFDNGLNNNQSDFTGIPNFTETDNCATFLSSSTPGQSCSITITFAPQESCSWAPGSQVSVAACPLTLNASLKVTSSVTADNDPAFAVPITGAGLSFVQPSVKEIDFGAEAVGEASLPQSLSFTNQSSYPVQIVGPRSSACQFSQNPSTLPNPVTNNGAVAGLQVVSNFNYVAGPPPLLKYNCDADQKTEHPNFQISADTCTGANLPPQGTCSVEISFIPQPTYTQLANGLDYFLELNTLQCSPQGASSDCEIDSGRFPVELKANGPSPLRMSPGAGLDFGSVPVGKTTPPQTITLFNDPNDPNTATVNFAGKFAVTGSFSETDDCPFVLAPGASCTLTVTFKPSSVGVNQGTINLAYTLGSNTRGNQFVYLRGAGQ